MNAHGDFAFFKGQYVPFEQANVSILNKTFMYGIGVFEGIRGYQNAAAREVYLFRVREHVERMFQSMKIMHLSVPYSVDEVCQIIVELARRNRATSDIYIRPAVYLSDGGITPCMAGATSDLCILTMPLGNYIDTDRGLKVQVSSWRRIEDNAMPARAKIIGAYVNSALAKTDAVTAGFDEAIMLSEDGHVSEGSAMNLFLVKDGQLVTSSASDNILKGITRDTVIEICAREFGIQSTSRRIDRSELYTADEAFFCGTGAQIAPITNIDGRTIGDGSFGPISRKIQDRYIDICRGNVPAYDKWLMPVYSTGAQVMELPIRTAISA